MVDKLGKNYIIETMNDTTNATIEKAVKEAIEFLNDDAPLIKNNNIFYKRNRITDIAMHNIPIEMTHTRTWEDVATIYNEDGTHKLVKTGKIVSCGCYLDIRAVARIKREIRKVVKKNVI